MASSRRALAALALSLLAIAPMRAARAQQQPTAQQFETARTLYKEGKELRAKGDLKGALEKLEAAHALGNTPVTGIELARTYVMVGKIVEAREVCLYVGRMPVAPDETDKSAEARAEAAKLAADLKPRIATVVVHVAGLQPGERARLVVDGVAVPEAAGGEPQKVNPGKHQIVARAGEGAAAREGRSSIEVGEGKTGEVSVTLPAPAAVPPPPPPPPPPSHPAPAHDSTLATMGFVVAGAGALVGVVAGFEAMSKRDALDTECNQQKQCDQAGGGSADLKSAHSWATLSSVGFGVGVAGALVGIYALVGKSEAPASVQVGGARVAPWIDASGAGVHGRF